MSKTLVVIPAHADDAELNAGGTIAKWSAEGGQVHVIMMTDNCSGIRVHPEQCTAQRHAEQEAAAALYGGTMHYRMYSQRHYWDVDNNRQISIDYALDGDVPACLQDRIPLVIAAQEADEVASLGEQLVSLKPDLVLTQTPLDRDPEHHAVASMIWRVFWERQEELADVSLRFWMPGSNCLDGLMPPPYDHFEDITDHYEQKLEFFGCHKSQLTDIRWKMIKERAAYFGGKAGVKYAEPFVTATRDVRFHR